MTSQQVLSSLYDKIRRFVAVIITPRYTTGSESKQLETHFVAILAAAVVLAAFNMLRHLTLNIDPVASTIAVGVIVTLYFIARFLQPRFSIFLAVVMMSALPFGVYLVSETMYSVVLMLVVTIGVILLAGLFLDFMLTLFITLVDSVLLVTFLLTANLFSLERLVDIILALVMIIGLTLFVVYRLQENRQRRQQFMQFQQWMTTLPDAVVVQAGGTIVFANAGALDLLNLSRQDEIEGVSLSDFLKQPADISPLLYPRRQATDAAYPLTRREQLISPGYGTNHPAVDAHDTMRSLVVDMTSTPVDYNGQMAALITLKKVDYPHKAALPPAVLAHIADHTTDAVLVLKADTQEIVYSNAAYHDLTGYDATATGDREPIVPALMAMYQRAIQQDEVICETVGYRRHDDDTIIMAEARAIPVSDSDRALTHIISIQRDISGEQRLEAKLHRQDVRSQVLSSLMSGCFYRIALQDDQPAMIDWVQGSMQQNIGYSADDLRAFEDWEALIYKDDRQLYRDHRQRILTGNSHTSRYRLQHRDGSLRWVSDSARLVTVDTDDAPGIDPANNPTYIYGALQDIDERIQAENALRDNVMQQAVVTELGLLALLKQDEVMLLNQAALLIDSVLEGNSSAIFVHDDAANRLTLAAIGLEDDAILEDDVLTLPADPTASHAGYTLHVDEPVIVDDYAAETRFNTEHDIGRRRFVSGASFVIQGQNQPYGVLTVRSPEKREFNPDEIYFLQSVANVIGIFIERQHAQEAEATQREFTDALREATMIINRQMALPDVLTKMQEFIATVVQRYEMSAILLLEPNRERVRVASNRIRLDSDIYRPDDDVYNLADFPIFQQVVQLHEAIRIDDTHKDDRWVPVAGLEWIRSYLCAPILINDRCIGFIDLNSSQVGSFTENDADRLITFAEKTATAIINAQRASELEAVVQQRTNELNREREHLQAMLDSSGEGIFYTEDNIIQYANLEMAKMTGYKLDEFIGLPYEAIFEEYITDDESTLTRIRRTIERGETWRNEHLLKRRDGTTFEAGLSVSAVSDPTTDSEMQTLNIVRDISQEKALERQQERFIANAAHELRSPIANLNTRMYLIRKQPDRAQDHLARLEIVINRMNQLVGDMLDLSSFEQGQVPLREESVIAQDLLSRIVELQKAEADLENITLTLDVDVEPVLLVADPNRLEQVFINLVTNAIHYTPAGGSVTVRCYTDATTAYIAISDTGQGIPQDDISQIFQPFYRVQRDKSGTGLGLSIALEIVERHGGTIEVESEMGSGSTFTVVLPLPDEPLYDE